MKTMWFLSLVRTCYFSIPLPVGSHASILLPNITCSRRGCLYKIRTGLSGLGFVVDHDFSVVCAAFQDDEIEFSGANPGEGCIAGGGNLGLMAGNGVLVDLEFLGEG